MADRDANRFADRDRRELHRLLAEAFSDAVELAGEQAVTFRAGREVIRVRTAGPALAGPLTRAVAHRTVDPATPPTATIDAFDSVSTGRPLPLLVDHLLRLLDRTWLEDRDLRGELRAFADGPIRAAQPSLAPGAKSMSTSTKLSSPQSNPSSG